MKKLVLLRPSHEALQLNIEEINDITTVTDQILRVRLSSGEEYLGYLIKFE
jgi:hypothetical protein